MNSNILEQIQMIKGVNSVFLSGELSKFFWKSKSSHDEVGLSCVLKGSRILCLDGVNEVVMKEGDFSVRTPMNTPDFYAKNNGDDMYSYMTIRLDVDRDFVLSDVFCNADPVVISLFNKIYKEWQNKDFGYKVLIKSLLYEIFGRVLREEKHKPYYQKIEESVKYLRKNYCNPDLSTVEIAKISKMSESYFRSIFVEIYGMSPKAYITELRLKKADELLQYTNLSIAEIALKTGFRNQQYFCNFYKNYKNMSPNKFRNSI